MATVARSRPWVVCLCGSTRFLDVFDDASLQQTLAGLIVLRIATTRTRDKDLFAALSQEERAALRDHLATLHRAKIDLADEILVINAADTSVRPRAPRSSTPTARARSSTTSSRSTQSSEAAADGVAAREGRALKCSQRVWSHR